MFSPFSGWLFNSAAIDDPGRATSPPYDVITDQRRADLLARSPHNIVRLLLPGTGAASYEDAAALISRWEKEGVLQRDDPRRMYLYEMQYETRTGVQRQAIGVIGVLELVPFGSRVIPHEETMGSHRADRLAVLEAIRANLDPIIALSPSPDLAALLTPDGEPRLDFVDQNEFRHRLFDITSPGRKQAISAAVARHPVTIADGHHRYTTALRYRDSRNAADGPGPWDGIMAFVAPVEGSGLTIGPYHRVLPPFEVDRGALGDAFEVGVGPPDPPSAPGRLVVVSGNEAYHLEPRSDALEGLPLPWRAASSAVARELFYPRLGIDEEGASYFADAGEALAAASSGEGTAVLVAPLTERAVAGAGEMGLRFPTKSTFFTPKPRAGLVIHRLEVDPS